jgi:hypothetical protein
MLTNNSILLTNNDDISGYKYTNHKSDTAFGTGRDYLFMITTDPFLGPSQTMHEQRDHERQNLGEEMNHAYWKTMLSTSSSTDSQQNTKKKTKREKQYPQF